MNILTDVDIQSLIGQSLGLFMLGWGMATLFKVIKKIGETL